MKKILLLTLVFMSMTISSIMSQNAPITTIGAVTSTTASASVNVTAVNFTNIGSYDFNITYDPAIVTVTDVIAPPGGYISWDVISEPGHLHIGWFTDDMTLPDNSVILCILFTKVSNGTSALTFYDPDPPGTKCIYYNQYAGSLNDLPYSTYYFNGSIAFSGNYTNTAPTGPTSVCAGDNGLVYSVTPDPNATGYIWLYSGTDATFSGGNDIPDVGYQTVSNSVTIDYSSTATSGNLTVYAVYSCGHGLLSPALAITVTAPPVVDVQPVNASVLAGANAAFSVSATGTGLTYQWQVSTNGGATWSNVSNGPVPGQPPAVYSTAATATLNIAGVTSGMDGYQYRCFIGATCGPVTSTAATLSMLCPLPGGTGTILGSPSQCLGVTGKPYSVTGITGVTGPGNFGYVWGYTGSGATIHPGTGIDNITVDFASNATNGSITVYGYNSCGNGQTWTKAITMNPLNVFTQQPFNIMVDPGNNTSFTVVVTGNPGAFPPYQWQVSTNGGANWSNVANGTVPGQSPAAYSTATTATLNIAGVTAGMNGYQYKCIFKGQCATIVSNAATLSMIPNAPKIYTPNATPCPGATVCIPFKVDDFTNIGAVSFHLLFNTSALTFVSGTSNTGFSLLFGNPDPGLITIGGTYGPPSGYSLGNGTTFFTLCFTYIGGSSGLSWDDSDDSYCEFAGPSPLNIRLHDDPWYNYYINSSVDPGPLAPGAITGDGDHCEGTGVTFTQGACPPGSTCYWVSSAIGEETTNSSPTYTTATTPGTYSVWVRAQDNTDHCWGPAVTASGTVYANPTVGYTGTTTLCLGSTTKLSGTGATSYAWSGGISNGVVFTPALGITTYTVTGTDVNLCTNTATATVTVNSSVPTITGPVSPPCKNSTGNVYTTEAGMSNYIWTVSSGGTITEGGTGYDHVTVTWNNAGAQSVSVNYTDGNDCTAAVPTVSNFTILGPTITGPVDVCRSTTAPYITYTYITESGKTNYDWTYGGGSLQAGGDGYNYLTVRWTSSGPRSVIVTYTDGTCTQTTTLPVTVHPNTPGMTGPYGACLNGTYTYNSTGPENTNLTYIVSAGGTVVGGGGPSDQYITVLWTTVGSKTITVTMPSLYGCTMIPTVYPTYVYALPAPSLSGPTPVCENSTGNVYNTEAGKTSYVWNVSAGGTITAGGTGTDNTVTVTWNTPGPQTISVNYTDSHGCTAAAPAIKNVTVNSNPAPPVSGGNVTVCANQLPATLVDNVPNGIEVDWYGSPVGGILLQANSATYSTSIPGIYYNEARDPLTGCVSTTRTATTLTVNPNPAPPVSGGNVTVCADQLPATLVDIVPQGIIVNWYDAATGGNLLLANSATYTTSIPGTYYNDAVDPITGCVSTTRTPTTLTVNPNPAPPVSGGNVTVCANQLPATLVDIVPQGIIVNWYDAATGGNLLLANSATYTTSIPGTYYNDAVDPITGCVSTTRTPTTLTVNPNPAPPVSGGNVTVCADQLPATLVDIVPQGIIVNWYDAATGGNLLLANSATYTTSIPGTYYNDAVDPITGCVSTTRTPTTLTVNPNPAPPVSGGNVTVCANQLPATLVDIVPQGIIVNWYDAATGGNLLLANSATYTTSIPGTYYNDAVDPITGCVSTTRTPTTLTVNPNPAPPVSGGNVTVCADQLPATLVDIVPQGIIVNWYDAATGGNLLLANSATYTTSIPGTYYNDAVDPITGCVSTTRTPTTLTVNPNPAPPVSGGNVTVCADQLPATLVDNVPNGIEVDWYDSPVGGILLQANSATYSTSIPGIYYNEARDPLTGCVSTTRTPTTLTVNPNPAPPVSGGNVTVCANQLPATLVDNVPNGIEVDWYDSPVGGILLQANSATYSTSIPGIYYNEARDPLTGCVSTTRTPTTLTVNPNPAPPVSGGNVTVCADQLPATLVDIVPQGIIVNWYDAATGGNLLLANSATYTTSIAGTYYNDAVDPITGCVSTTRTPTTLTVNPNPAPPVSGGNVTVCADQLPATLVDIVPQGIIVNWYDAATGGNLLLANSATYTTSIPGTYYNDAVDPITGCVSTTRTPTTLTVNPNPAPPVSGGNVTVCANQLPATLVDIVPQGIIVNWYDAATGGNLLLANSATYTTSIPGTYYNDAVDPITGCVSTTRTPTTLTVNPNPAPPVSGGNVTVCADQLPATLVDIVPQGIIVNWYDAATGGNLLLANSATYTTSIAGTYYNDAVDPITGCVSTTRTPTTLTVNPNPAPPVSGGNVTVCANQLPATLVDIVPQGIIVNWYDAATGGNLLLANSATYTTSIPGTYYNDAVDPITGCVSTTRTPTTLTVNPNPAPPVSGGNVTVCADQLPATLVDIVPQGIIVNWYDAATGGNLLLANSATYTTSIPGTYYNDAVDPITGCVSTTRTPTTLTVNPNPAPPVSGGNVTVCADQLPATLVDNVPNGIEVDWYDSPVGGILLQANSATYSTSIPGIYYNEARDPLTGCVSTTRTPTTLTVNPNPAPPVSGGNVTVCANQLPATLVDNVPNGIEVDWYDSPVGGILLQANSATYSTSIPGIYYNEARDPLTGCVSTTRTPTTLTVNPNPAPPVSGGNVTVCADQLPATLVDIVPQGIIVNWYDAATGGNLLLANSATYTTSIAGTYYNDAVDPITGCVSTTRTPTTLTVNPNPAPPVSGGNVTVCADQLPATLVDIVPQGIIVNWYDAATGGNLLLANSATYTTSIPGTYYNDAVDPITGCVSTTRTPTTLTVNPNPAPPVSGGNVTVCANQLPATLVDIVPQGIIVNWYDAATGGNLLLANSATYTTSIPGTYYNDAVDPITGCVSTTRTPTTLTVNPNPAPPVSGGNVTVCADQLPATLVDIVPQGIIVNWYDAATGGNLLLANSATYTTSIPGTYYNDAVDPITGCVSTTRTPTTLTVNPNPAPPVSGGNVTVCANQLPATLVDIVPQGIIVNWYDAATGGNLLLANSATYTTSIPGTYYNDAVDPITGCVSTTRTPTTLTVNPNPAPPVSGGNVTVCADQLPATLVDIVPQGIIVNWYDAATGGNLLLANSATYTTSIPGTYYNDAVDPITGCVSTTRTPTTLTVNPNPAPPVSGGNVTVCADQLPATLVDNVPNGIEVDWYDSPVGGILLQANSATYSTSIPGIYYNEARDPLTGCVSTTRTPTTLTVNPNPAPPVSGGNVTVCANQLPATLVDNVPNGIEVDWYDSPVGGILLQANSATYSTSIPGIYYNEARDPLTGCVSTTRTPTTLTVNPNPAPPVSGGNVTVCADQLPATLVDIVPQGIIVNWYDAATGGNLLLANSATYTTSIAGTYYNDAVDPITGCVSTTRTPTTLTVNPNPAPPVSGGNVTVCADQLPATLVDIVPQGIIVNWYDAATGGNLLLANSATYTTSIPGTYYNDAVDPITGCVSTTRTPTTLTVNPNPAPPVSGGNVTVCANQLPATLVDIVPQGIIVNWYDAATGGNLLLANSATYTTSIPGTYYNDAVDPITGCVSTTRTPTTLTVNPNPAPPVSGGNVTVCADQLPATLVDIVPQGIIVNWYDAATGGNLLLANSATYTTSIAGTYYNDAVDPITGCVSTTRTPTTLTVNPNPAPPVSGGNVTVCANQLPATLVDIVPQGIIVNWYDAATGGNLLLANSATYTTSIPGTYYNDAVDPITGCVSTTRTPTTLTVNPNPAPPVSGGNVTVCADQLPATLVDNVPNGIEVDWYDSPVGGILLQANSATYSTSIPGIYYNEARDPLTGCVSTTRTATTLTVNPNPAPPVSGGNVTVCADQLPATLVDIVPQGIIVNWYDAATGGNLLLANSATYTTSIPGTYYNDAVDPITGCVSTTRTATTLTVNPTPVITGQPINSTIVEGGSTSFSVTTDCNNVTSYEWQVYNGATWSAVTNGGVYSNAETGTLNITNAPIWMSGYQYFCVINCANCLTWTNTVTLTVNPVLVAIIVGVADPCIDHGYAYTTEAGKSNYIWTVSAGGTISTGQSPNEITVDWNTLGPQNVSVTYISNGNIASGTKNVTVHPIANLQNPPGANLIQTATQGVDKIFTVVSVGDGLTYQWQASVNGGPWAYINDNVIINGGYYTGSNTTELTFHNAQPGLYQFQCLVTYGICWYSTLYTSPYQLTVNCTSLPTAGISGNAAVCLGGTPPDITFTPGNGVAPYTINYKINSVLQQPPLTTNNNGDPVTITAPTGTAGIYVYELVSVSDNGGCIHGYSGQTATVTVLPYYTITSSAGPNGSINPDGITSVCSGNSVTYTMIADPNYHIESVLVDGNPVATVSPYTFNNVLGNHTIDVTFAISCIAPNGVTASSNSPICAGNILSLTSSASGGTQPFTISWSGAGTFSAPASDNTTVTGAATGNYTVVYSNACGSNSASVPVTVNSLPVPVITGPDVVCAGTTGVTYATEPGMNGYSWSISPGGIITAGTGTYSITVTWNSAGARSLSVNYTNNGCTAASATIKNVTVNPLTAIITQPANVTINEGGSTSFSVTAIGPGLGYQWQLSIDGGSVWNDITNGGMYANATAPTLNITGATIGMSGYKYKCIVSGTCGTIISSTATLLINVDCPFWSLNYVLLASEHVELKGCAVHSGGVGAMLSNGKIEAKDNTQITAGGTFAQAVDISVDNSSAITVQNPWAANPTIPSFEPVDNTGTINFHVPNNLTVYITGNLYHDIEVGKNATAIFTQPVIDISHNLKLNDGATIRFLHCGKVHIGEEFKLEENSTLNPDNVSVVFYLEKGMHAKKNCNVKGVFYSHDPDEPQEALEGELKIDHSDVNNHGSYTGVFMFEKIDAEENNDFYWNANCNNCPAFPIISFVCPNPVLLCNEDSTFQLSTMIAPNVNDIVSFSNNQPAVFPVGTTTVTWTVNYPNGSHTHPITTVTRYPKIGLIISSTGHLCVGQVSTVTLTATSTNTTTPIYNWTDALGNTIIGTGTGGSSISITSAGTYYVTVMENSNVTHCSVSDSIVIGWSPLPTVSLEDNPTTLCSGSTLALTTTGDQICFECPTNPNNVNAEMTIIYSTLGQEDVVTIRTKLAKTFVDNTYGTNAIGWPNGHTFANLTGSDKMQLSLYDNSNVLKMQFTMDYISADAGAPSGYKSLGVAGGDGSMQFGNASDILSVVTSLDYNFNTLNYVLTTNSPLTNSNYDPDPNFQDWIYDVWYECTVKLSAFGTAGFGVPSIGTIHASPSKTGNNTEPVVQVPCDNNNGGGNLTYTWTWPGPPAGSATGPTLPVTTTGTYTVTASNNYGCTASDAITITVNPSPTVTISGNNTVCSGTQTTLAASGNSASYSWSNGMTTSSITVTPTATTTYTVTGTLNGCTGTASITVTVIPVPTVTLSASPSTICSGSSTTLTANGDQLCFESPTNPNNVNAEMNFLFWTLGQDDVVTIRTKLAKTFVDNTYGSNAIGWPSGHTFANLTGSDKMQLSLYDNSNVLKMQFTMDYISAYAGLPSGYKSLGVTGGDGSMQFGNVGDIVSVVTSLDYNFNTLNYVLTTNSPVTNSNYDPDPNYPDWIYDVWYDVTVKLSAFGTAGFGVPSIGTIHASPSKTGNNTEPVVQVPCDNNNGGGNLTYTWIPGGSNGSTITVTPPSTTTYTVTASDGNCTASDAVTVTVNPVPVLALSPPVTICQGTSTTLTASGAVSYNWSNGMTGNSINVTPATTTTYIVTGTTGGCTSSANVTVTVNPKPTVTVTASPSQICIGSSSTLTASGALTYNWSGGTPNGPNTDLVTPTANTTYYVTGTDANGCTNTASVNITVKALPTVTLTASPATICAGASSTLSASGASSYVWGGGTSGTGSSKTVTPGGTTLYSVVGTNNYGCTASASVTVNVNQLPTVTVSATPATICQGSSSTLQASGATSFTWNNGLGSGNPKSVSPSGNTTYIVTGTDANTCQNTASVSVAVNLKPTVTLAASSTGICVGTSVTLTAGGASTYSWSSGGTGNLKNVTPPVTTTYVVTGTDAYNCSNTASVLVTVDQIPVVTASASPATVCSGVSSTLTASGASTYVWSGGLGTGSSKTVTPLNLTNSNTVASYVVTGTTTFGCTASGSVSITVKPSVQLFASPTTICSGSSSNLTAYGSTTGLYNWNNNLGNNQGPNKTVTPTSTTTYSVTGTITNGCTTKAGVTVTVNSLPNVTASASPATICLGSSSTLTASGATSYNWSNGLGTGNSKVVTPTGTGTTAYTVTGTNNNGCTKSATVSVTVNAIPNVAISPSATQTICSGTSITFTASGAATYSWNNGAGTGNPKIVTPASSTTYTVTGTIAGCTNTASVGVIVNPKPTVTVTANPSTIPKGQSSTLTAAGASTYSWSNGQGTGNPKIVAPTSTTTYTVTGTSAAGCTNSAKVTVTVTKGSSQNITSGETEREEEIINPKVDCYPNPFNSKTNIIFSIPENDRVRIDVYDLTGKLIITLFDGDALMNKEYAVEFDGKSLTTGIYFYKLTTTNEVYTGKMMLRRE